MARVVIDPSALFDVIDFNEMLRGFTTLRGERGMSLRSWLGGAKPCCPYHAQLSADPADRCGRDPRAAPIEPVRAIAWREAWGCWVATRDGTERIVDIHSDRAREWTPHFLASCAGDEWSERPEPWIEAALAGLAAVKGEA